jgi:hypothetical protein
MARRRASNLPPGVSDADIERQANGDPPPAEPLTPLQKAAAARLAGTQRPRHPTRYHVTGMSRDGSAEQLLFVAKSKRGATKWVEGNSRIILAGYTDLKVYRVRQVYPEAV